jgi:hypothetical protein
MKPFLAAAAFAVLTAAGPAIAQDQQVQPAQPSDKSMSTTTDAAGNYYTESEQSDFLASKLIGARVYATTKDIDDTQQMTKVSTDWDDIGEVNNIIIGKDGSVKAVVLGIGGFLSMGEKNVAVKMDAIRFVKKSGDDASDFYIVVKSDKAALEKAPTWKSRLDD